MSEWRGIDTAPKDATPIDLWAVDSRRPHGHRVPDAHRAYAASKWPDVWVNSNGHYVNVSRYYDDEGDECLQLGNTPHPKAKWSVKATHWMPHPSPPVDLPHERKGAGTPTPPNHLGER